MRPFLFGRGAAARISFKYNLFPHSKRCTTSFENHMMLYKNKNKNRIISVAVIQIKWPKMD